MGGYDIIAKDANTSFQVMTDGNRKTKHFSFFSPKRCQHEIGMTLGFQLAMLLSS